MIALIPLTPAMVLDEWFAISRILRKAMSLDLKRTRGKIAVETMAGKLRYWRVNGDVGAGYFTTMVASGVFWIIYIGGRFGSYADKLRLKAEIETIARLSKCGEIRFEGRDGRRFFPDYEATKGHDGRWNYRKELRA